MLGCDSAGAATVGSPIITVSILGVRVKRQPALRRHGNRAVLDGYVVFLAWPKYCTRRRSLGVDANQLATELAGLPGGQVRKGLAASGDYSVCGESIP